MDALKGELRRHQVRRTGLPAAAGAVSGSPGLEEQALLLRAGYGDGQGALGHAVPALGQTLVASSAPEAPAGAGEGAAGQGDEEARRPPSTRWGRPPESEEVKAEENGGTADRPCDALAPEVPEADRVT